MVNLSHGKHVNSKGHFLARPPWRCKKYYLNNKKELHKFHLKLNSFLQFHWDIHYIALNLILSMIDYQKFAYSTTPPPPPPFVTYDKLCVARKKHAEVVTFIFTSSFVRSLDTSWRFLSAIVQSVHRKALIIPSNS